MKQRFDSVFMVRSRKTGPLPSGEYLTPGGIDPWRKKGYVCKISTN